MRYFGLLIFSLMLFGCSPSTGDQIPEFSATTLNGNTISSVAMQDKITVINIWATWCGMCLGEFDQLNGLVKKYNGDKQVQFIAITDDSEQKVKKLLINRKLNYQHIVGREDIKDLFQRGLRQAIPQHLVINQYGKIVFDVSESSDGIANRIAEKIEELKSEVKN